MEKSEKRLSTKDDLTGQESKEDNSSDGDMDVAERPMNHGYTHEMEDQVQIDSVEKGVEGQVDQEEIFGESEFDEDSDHDIKIYNV